MTKKLWRISLWLMLAVILCACAKSSNLEKKVQDLDFTVVGEKDISEELKKHIDERKEETFTLIYKDGENMYLIIGYGRQSGGGYSIRVNDLYLGEQAVNVSTSLEGPDAGQNEEKEITSEIASFPYIVLKIETIEAPVIFDI